MKKFWNDINSDFQCQHCGSFVSAARFLAGVGNRNHCPYCLWSQHLDLFKAGDRLAACKAPMRPVGLTIKRSRKKYANTTSGELMLVHQCTDCFHISINRIAADDIAEVIMEVYEGSMEALGWLKEHLSSDEIQLLKQESYDLIYRQLFGQSVGSAYEIIPIS